MNIEIAKRNLSQVRVQATEPELLEDGQARLQVRGFALSSNNITYAVLGDMLSYWQFFPSVQTEAAETDAADWGRVPVWGFGEVTESRSVDVSVGELFYGYFPMASELVMKPGRANDRAVTDTSEHRSGLAAAYSRYTRCATDPIYRADSEQQQMLLYPLFFTAFLIEDFLLDHQDFGSQQLVISSASSKTAVGVAYLARQRGLRVCGLTSEANLDFTKSLNVYDNVYSYEQIDQLDQERSVFVDIAGNSQVLLAVHTHLTGCVEFSMTVGGTHWNHATVVSAPQLPAPEPQFFFAPTQILHRTKDWGTDGLEARVSSAWGSYRDWTNGWIEFKQAQGADEVVAAYLVLLGGRADPRTGYICSL